jgi:ribosome biogenesis GTPase A
LKSAAAPELSPARSAFKLGKQTSKKRNTQKTLPNIDQKTIPPKNLQKTRQEEQEKVTGNVVETDGIGDVVDEYSDLMLFFILIWRYLRRQYLKMKRQIKAAFQRQSDEEVLAILKRENEGFMLKEYGERNYEGVSVSYSQALMDLMVKE